jgi:murein DD-endopeptidase MepM/ murein hydrolase activator NlpD
MNLFTGRNLNNDECIFDVHSFARELDEDTLRTEINGGSCGGDAPSAPSPSGGGNPPSAPAVTATTPTTNPGTSPTTNTPNPSDPSNPGSGYTGGGYEPPPEVMSNPQAYGYWKALQALAEQQGDPDRYKDYNVLGTKFKTSFNKTQTQKNQVEDKKEIIMGENVYNKDFIKKNVPLQYQHQALDALEREEKAGKYGAPTDSKRITGLIGEGTALQSSHTGVDIGALTPGVKGDPIYATADGVVKRNTRTANSGSTLVELSLPYTNDTAIYQHAEFIVEQGDTVKRGQVIGYMSDEGTEGQVHLHYEIRKDGLYAGDGGAGQLVDPLTRMPGLYYYEKH